MVLAYPLPLLWVDTFDLTNSDGEDVLCKSVWRTQKAFVDCYVVPNLNSVGVPGSVKNGRRNGGKN